MSTGDHYHDNFGGYQHGTHYQGETNETRMVRALERIADALERLTGAQDTSSADDLPVISFYVRVYEKDVETGAYESTYLVDATSVEEAKLLAITEFKMQFPGWSGTIEAKEVGNEFA